MEISCLAEENKNDQCTTYKTKDNINRYNSTKKEMSDTESSTKLKSKKSTKRSSEKFSEIKQRLSEVTVEDLQKLCEQISVLNKRIMNARGITYLRYELPVEMKEKLEMEAQELECLYAEMKDATRNLEIIRIQRAALGKEKQSMEAQTNKLKAEAVTEMEMIVSVYDSDMMDRWENIKQSTSVPDVENFLHDVKGRLEAMKNLQILGANKLEELQNKQNDKGEVITKKEKKMMNREQRASRGGGGRNNRSGSSLAISSQSTLPFLFDTDSEDFLDETNALNTTVYNLVYDQVFNMNFPAWTNSALDID